MDVPSEIIALLDMLTVGIRAALGENLVGVYLRGSLAMGDFDPTTSDVDVFTITERRVSEDEFAALAALHAALAGLPNPYGDQLEGTYIERAAAWRYEPGKRFPTIGRAEPLKWSAHGANWMLERWTVREQGIALLGPDPRTLIAPVSREDLRAAIRDRLRDWADFACRPDDSEWRGHRGHKAYIVETMAARSARWRPASFRPSRRRSHGRWRRCPLRRATSSSARGRGAATRRLTTA